MARNFDGVDDELFSADNALAGMNVAQKSVSFWISIPSDPTVYQTAIYGVRSYAPAPGWWVIGVRQPATAGWRIQYDKDWSTDGQWVSSDITSGGVRHHIAVMYDRGATTNNPVMYVDGTSVTVTTTVTPAGTVGTGDDTLRIADVNDDLAATMSHLVIAVNTLWDAATVKRAMYWGRPHGGLLVYHPFTGPKLADEGSGAETLTATGTTVAAFATPVVRPGSAAMGMGVGW